MRDEDFRWDRLSLLLGSQANRRMSKGSVHRNRLIYEINYTFLCYFLSCSQQAYLSFIAKPVLRVNFLSIWLNLFMTTTNRESIQYLDKIRSIWTFFYPFAHRLVDDFVVVVVVLSAAFDLPSSSDDCAQLCVRLFSYFTDFFQFSFSFFLS